MGDADTQMWIDAAMHALANGGIDRVRVEVLAQNLGITKGGFYRRFKDRRALLDAVLMAWQGGRIAAIEKQADLGEVSPRDRLNALLKLFAERVSAQGMAIELAVRQWARSDKAAAATVERVDTARLKSVAKLYVMLGLTPQQAEVRAILFYAYIFGQGLLFLNQSPRQRARLVTDCAQTLTDVESPARLA